LEQSWSFPSCFTPIDHHLHRSPPAAEDEDGGVGGVSKFSSGLFSPSPRSKTPAGSGSCCSSLSYEPLFDLALPRAASLFVARRTSERFSQLEEGFEDGEEEEEAVAASPLEVLDRLVQQGSDAHDKALKRYGVGGGEEVLS